MRSVLITLIQGLLALLISVPSVLARPAFHAQMLKQFHLERNAVVLEAGCSYCHSRPQGGLGMNPFGIALDRRVPEDAALSDVAGALYAQLAARQDSDNDGFDDVLEVVAGTLPGDAKSKPQATGNQLEAELKKLGGLEQFKPR